jgi:tetratricopeptide (TPR) repeat protein
MKLKLGLLIILLAATAARAQTNDLTLLLQQGLFEEQANRNLDAAIVNYQMLAAQFDKDRQLAATAVFRLGECYRAEGKTNEAAEQYQRILSNFPDQTTLATLSRQDLAGMGMGALQPRFGAQSKSPEQQVLEIEALRAGAETNLTSPDEATDAQDQEIQRIKLLIQNSPDLINSSGNGNL